MRRLIIANALSLLATASYAHGAGMLADADTDKDGQVTREEFVSARAAQFSKLDRNRDGFLDETDKRRRRGSEDVARRADTDGDGKVSKEEFVSAPTRAFDMADADRNDVLDADELAQARAALKHQIRSRRI